MAYFLDPQERQKAAHIIANLYQFTDGGPQGRRVLLWQAGLQKFVSGENLSNTPDLVAGSIISKLEPYGYLRDRPVYHALGALLNAVLELPEVSAEDKAFLAQLIAKYQLVLDPVFQERLREEYKVEIPQKTPPAQPTPPAPARVEVAEPKFDVDHSGLERVIHSEDNFLDIEHLANAVLAAQAVCRIEIPEGQPQGTGFLIAPNLVLTNQHVVSTKGDVASTVARFDYMEDLHGVAQRGRIFAADPSFYESSPSEKLDYALIRLAETPLKEFMPKEAWEDLPALEVLRRRRHRGYLLVLPRVVTTNERINIIQHPLGHPLKAVLTDNNVAAVSALRVQYVADTDEGSSGSPVFDRNWGVVALHHSGKPYPPELAGNVAKRYWKGQFRVNEGIPMASILKDFEVKGFLGLLPRS
jgi:V8-like Glu-specific endopeptidase